MVGQVLWAVVVAVLLPAVSVGWAIRGAMMVREWMIPPRERANAKPPKPIQPELLRILAQRRMIVATGFFLAIGFFFLNHAMGGQLSMVAAMVLAFAYAVLCATVTGFAIWVRAQQHAQDGRPLMSESPKWSMWVGVGLGAVAILYLVVSVVPNLMG